MGIKSAIESLWIGRMKVITRQQTKNSLTKQNEFVEKVIFENEPCRLSFSNITSTTNTVGAAEIEQTTKLFCSPTLHIPEGSKIVITQNNRISEHTQSGKPAVYTHHQEIVLKPFERWA